MRDLMFMVEPVHWAPELNIQESPTLKSKALPEPDRTEGPGKCLLVGGSNRRWRRCVRAFPIHALLHIGLETWEWGTPKAHGWGGPRDEELQSWARFKSWFCHFPAVSHGQVF